MKLHLKKQSLLAALSLVSLTTKAQIFGFGFGYNLSFLNADSINFIIDRYNDTRSYLDVEMKHMNIFKGPSFTIQGSGGSGKVGLFFDIGRDWTRARAFAQTDTFGPLEHRDVRIKLDAWHIGFGLSFRGGPVVLSPGISIDIGTEKAETRVGPADQVKKQDWSTVIADNNVYAALFCQVLLGPRDGFVRLSLQPYYRFAVSDQQFWPLNEAINPATWFTDSGLQTQKMSHAGLRLLLMLLLSS